MKDKINKRIEEMMQEFKVLEGKKAEANKLVSDIVQRQMEIRGAVSELAKIIKKEEPKEKVEKD